VSFSYTFSPAGAKTFQVLRCRACTHAYCHPIPSDIAKNYRDVVDEEYMRHVDSRYLSSERLVSTVQQYHASGRLLDVGCATGDFLRAAKARGYDVDGIELSDWSSRIARQAGLSVHNEYLEGYAKRCPGYYDFVTLWGVIEHFANPRHEMQSIAALLRPGGILALWTGDVDSITSRVLGRKWWYWQGQHIQYFTHRSLTRLATDHGLEPVSTERYPFAASFETISNSLRRYRSHQWMTALMKPVFRVRPIWYLRLPGELLFLARKRAAGPTEGA
jgi:SAM-dependent methyltransferase